MLASFKKLKSLYLIASLKYELHDHGTSKYESGSLPPNKYRSSATKSHCYTLLNLNITFGLARNTIPLSYPHHPPCLLSPWANACSISLSYLFGYFSSILNLLSGRRGDGYSLIKKAHSWSMRSALNEKAGRNSEIEAFPSRSAQVLRALSK